MSTAARSFPLTRTLALGAILLILCVGLLVSRAPTNIGRVFPNFSGVAAEQALHDTMQVQANKLQQFRVLSNQAWGLKRLLVYSYVVQPRNQPPHQEVGYALTEMRNGWSTIPGAVVADTQTVEPVTYATAAYDDYPIVYGRVRDPQVQQVVVVFDNGMQQTAQLTNGSLVLVGRRNTHVREVLLYDTHGNLMKSYQTDGIYDQPQWK